MLQEAFRADNFTATKGPFTVVLGGLYAFTLKGGTFSSDNTVSVGVLAEDGTTEIVALAGPTSGTTFYDTVYLPPGQISFVVTGTVTAVYAALARCPQA